MDELRKKGLEKMNEVYGWEMPDMPGEYFALTVDHLFGTIWTPPGLSMRDRRMMLLGVLAAQGMEELMEVQANAILAQRGDDAGGAAGDRDLPHPLRRVPAGLQARRRVQTGGGQTQEGRGEGRRRETRRHNVNDAVQMHVGRNIHDK